VAGQVLSTLTATFALSFLGTAGTLAGLTLGAALSAVLPVLYENALVLSHHRARQALRRSRPVTERSYYDTLYREPSPRPAIPWKRLSLATLMLFAVSAAAVTGIEVLTGKPVSAVVTNTHGSGFTFSGGNSNPAPPPSSPSSPSPAVTTVSPSVTGSFSPGETSTPSVTPSQTPSPAQPVSPAVTTGTPAFSPTASAVPQSTSSP
jgi:hypothetical protein